MDHTAETAILESNEMRRKRNIFRSELGATMTEYAVTFLFLIPIVAGITLLYSWNSQGEVEGAFVERGEASLGTAKSMSPTNAAKHCDSGAPYEVSKEFCF